MELLPIDYFMIFHGETPDDNRHRVIVKLALDKERSGAYTIMHPTTALKLSWKIGYLALKLFLTKKI